MRLESHFIILPVTKNNTVRVLPINDTLHRILSDVPQKAGITDFRFHDLRHTYASHLAMRGVHIRDLQELLGHKTLAMTQRYSHFLPEQLHNAEMGAPLLAFQPLGCRTGWKGICLRRDRWVDNETQIVRGRDEARPLTTGRSSRRERRFGDEGDRCKNHSAVHPDGKTFFPPGGAKSN